MTTKRWVDVEPNHWYYRSVLESDRIFMDAMKEQNLFGGKVYNKFVSGHERRVVNFLSTEGQTKFEVPNYTPHSKEDVFIYIEGVLTVPSKLEVGWVHLGNPISGDVNVTIYFSGVPAIKESTDDDCREYPQTTGCAVQYPSADLQEKLDYVFDIRYSLNEVVTCMGRKLKRVNVNKGSAEPVQAALERGLGHHNDRFTIIDGVLYVSYNLNGFPVLVNYNYLDPVDNVVKNRQGEVAIPESPCALYNDRFFANITITKAEFFVILQRMRENLYHRYTDRGYVSNTVNNTERIVKDRDQIVGKWYDRDVLNILDEKFLDGCYVFPLYSDDTFEPNSCVTRAEAIVYLHRFTEWSLERFR